MKLSYLIALALSLSFLNANSQQSKNSKLKNKDQKSVLFVLTSHDKLGDTGEKTGFWAEEFAAPYYYLLDKGVKITVASPKGGKAPIDPRSISGSRQSEATNRFQEDITTQKIIDNTVKLEDVRAEEFDAVFYPGGHGPLWDLAEDKTSIALIESFNKQGKPMAFVCHAPAALKNVKDTNGEPLVKGKKVTSFSNTEEDAVQLTNVVPFLVEDMLKKSGADYTESAKWSVNVVEDGNLITGQNPASSQKAAEKLYDLLN